MRTMDKVDLRGKRVLIREDLNVPIKDARITNRARIEAAVDTILAAARSGASVMVMSHLGRPTEGQYDPQYSLKPVAQALGEALGEPVRFESDWIDGVTVSPGEIVLLENVRFLVGEKADDESLARKMASLCDVFVMDAFATAHRAQASTHGVAKFAPEAVAGPLLMREIEALRRAMDNPRRPLVAIVGGAKVSGKLELLDRLGRLADQLIVGGGIANTFLAAAGHRVGASLYEPALLDQARAVMEAAEARGAQIPLPTDVVVAEAVSADAKATTKACREVRETEMILDVGPQTAGHYQALLADAGTIIWNGPVGVFEYSQFAAGTAAVAEAVAASSGYSLAGGGDTVAAIEQFGVQEGIDYISTGGGAFLEFLEGKTLPGIAVLEARSG